MQITPKYPVQKRSKNAFRANDSQEDYTLTPANARFHKQSQPIESASAQNTTNSHSQEQVYVSVPNTFAIRQTLHTKTYMNYLENLKRTPSISNWSQYLTSTGNQKITQSEPNLIRSAHNRKVSNEELVHELHQLKDKLLESTCGIKRTT